MDSKKFELRNFDTEGILTQNHVNTVIDKRNWTDPSDSVYDLVLLTEV